MKYSDSGDYCMLYLEPSDDRTCLFNTIARQQKPVVILLTERIRVLQRPEDFAALKHIKRQLDVPIVFVIEGSEHLTQLAGRHGFPVYSSMDALADALSSGHLGRQRVLNRATAALDSSEPHVMPKRTIPLGAPSEERAIPKTAPLAGKAPLTGTLPAKASYATTAEQPVRQQLRTGPLTPPAEKPAGAAYQPVTPAPPSPAKPLETSYWSVTPPPVSRPVEQPQRVMPSSAPATKTRRGGLLLAMIVLALIAMLLAGVGAILVLFNKMPTSVATAPTTVGQIKFLSSEQLSENSSQGINDQVVVDLNNLTAPSQGKSYYAWLLGDRSESDLKAVLLGALTLANGHAHLLYTGDAQHTNLLLITSRFLVTEEDAVMTPVSPSPDTSTWRYYGEFMQTPNAQDPDHFSYLDHLRHLLASDPVLDDMELPGGLNTWFYRNTGKILEWSSSMREQWEEAKDAGFVHRMAIRTLTYLDGLAFVQQDLPPNTALLVNERLARIGLLNVGGPNQDPACYLSHIDRHLDGVLRAGAATPTLRGRIAGIVTALDSVKSALMQVRHDAQLIMKMSDKQLQQPSTLDIINDMIDSANHAYTGQTDPNTGQMHQGVVWIHEQIQALATVDITKFSASGSVLELIQDTRHMKVFH